MTENLAARGEGLAGLAKGWLQVCDKIMAGKGAAKADAEDLAYADGLRHCAADVKVALAAAPAGTAQLTNERRRDVVEPIAQWLHHQISAACNDKWEEGDNCSDCEQSVMSELFPLMDRALATPSPQRELTPYEQDQRRQSGISYGQPAATQEQPAGSGAVELLRLVWRQYGIKGDIPAETLERIEKYLGENEIWTGDEELDDHFRRAGLLRGSPRKVGEDAHRLLESDLVGWWGRCSCGWNCEDMGDWTKHLKSLRSSSAPVGEQPKTGERK